LTRCLDDPQGDQMRRRDFIADSTALLVSLRRSRAEGAPRRVGYLGSFEFAPTLDGNSLRKKGWVESKKLVGYRYAKSPDRLLALAAELIVLAPIASSPKLVQSLSRPGGNVTGLCDQCVTRVRRKTNRDLHGNCFNACRQPEEPRHEFPSVQGTARCCLG